MFQIYGMRLKKIRVSRRTIPRVNPSITGRRMLKDLRVTRKKLKK